MSQIFFTSDAHFGSDDIIARENRPFKNHKAFKKYAVKLWNKQASKEDTIYFIGDFIDFSSNNYEAIQKSLDIVKEINAKVVLILGNNEEAYIKENFSGFDSFKKLCIEKGFFDVKKYDTLVIDGTKVYLNHHPSKHKKDCFNLFGHTHRATGLWKPFGINVGCDLNHFKLYSIEDIKNLMDVKTKYWDPDKEVFCM